MTEFSRHPLFEDRRLQLTALSGLMTPEHLRASFNQNFSPSTLERLSANLSGSASDVELMRAIQYSLAIRLPQDVLRDALHEALDPEPLLSGRLDNSLWHNMAVSFKARIVTLFSCLDRPGRSAVAQQLLAIGPFLDLMAEGARGQPLLECRWHALAVLNNCFSEEMRAFFMQAALTPFGVQPGLTDPTRKAQALQVAQRQVAMLCQERGGEASAERSLERLVQSAVQWPAVPGMPDHEDQVTLRRAAFQRLVGQLGPVEQQWEWRSALDFDMAYVNQSPPPVVATEVRVLREKMQALAEAASPRQALVYLNLATDPAYLRRHTPTTRGWNTALELSMAGVQQTFPRLLLPWKNAAEDAIGLWRPEVAARERWDLADLVSLLAQATILKPQLVARRNAPTAVIERKIQLIRETIGRVAHPPEAVSIIDAIAERLHREGTGGDAVGTAGTAGTADLAGGGSSSSSSSSSSSRAAAAGQAGER